MDDLPPSYPNLDIDGDPVAGPSAPRIPEEHHLQKDLKNPASTFCAQAIPDEEHKPRPLVYIPPALEYEDVYDACLEHVRRSSCIRPWLIKKMTVKEITNKGVFTYTLESFCEKRQSRISQFPYEGGPIDGPENGPAPDPWDIQVSPLDVFKDGTAETDIPHTTVVDMCTKCNGRGQKKCEICDGGRLDCMSDKCYKAIERGCEECTLGKKDCYFCNGTARTPCSKCKGFGKFKSCNRLLITWTTRSSQFISDAGNLPDKKIRKAKSIEMMRESDIKLEPIEAPDKSVSEASAIFLGAHRRTFPDERILQQRHSLQVIPYTRVTYRWRMKEGEFFVYGTDRAVEFEKYPRCCIPLLCF